MKELNLYSLLKGTFPVRTFNVSVFDQDYLQYEENSHGDGIVKVDEQIKFVFGLWSKNNNPDDATFIMTIIDLEEYTRIDLDELPDDYKEVYDFLMSLGIDKISFYQ